MDPAARARTMGQLLGFLSERPKVGVQRPCKDLRRRTRRTRARRNLPTA
jgi:hypothetical protein